MAVIPNLFRDPAKNQKAPRLKFLITNKLKVWDEPRGFLRFYFKAGSHHINYWGNPTSSYWKLNFKIQNAIVALCLSAKVTSSKQSSSAFTPFCFYHSLFFPILSHLFFSPFITSKAFLFQIIIEVIFALYLVLAIQNNSFWPKKSLLLGALGAYFGAIFLSAIFGIDVSRSLFGNYERMWGFFQLAHFFLFFIILAGVFKTKEDFIWGHHTYFCFLFFIMIEFNHGRQKCVG